MQDPGNQIQVLQVLFHTWAFYHILGFHVECLGAQYVDDHKGSGHWSATMTNSKEALILDCSMALDSCFVDC